MTRLLAGESRGSRPKRRKSLKIAAVDKPYTSLAMPGRGTARHREAVRCGGGVSFFIVGEVKKARHPTTNAQERVGPLACESYTFAGAKPQI
jgi:hypothetical protein